MINWKNKKFWLVIIGIVFLSSMFYGAFRSRSIKGGKTLEVSVGVDFGSGQAYPEKYRVPNETALWILNRTVKSLKVENGSVKCISRVCENESREWVFQVNGQNIRKKPSLYYPKDQDLLVFKYVNRSG